ncbi:hypothetical protein FHL15_002286 [Xylaria flabelliformis]|uniref:Uncharacterized protein n=1 Tax=Xylaria flabelliformis TaxID=2512241 RepID=A0A553I9V6_9PEZI|nr:hypothetical protein FHL15_002286 [Xylaria flabelliformis]
MTTQSSNDGQYPVYVGVWTNWSRGQVLGLTLTLKREEANLLIAFTAFFITFVSARFWRIMCFAFHRHYATSSSREAVHHQRQAILRNSSTPESGLQLFLRLIWTNRHSKSRFHLFWVVVAAVTSIAAFTAASGLSSQISTAVGTEVLIKSLNCGSLNLTNFTASDGITSTTLLQLVQGPRLAEKANNAANYAQQCYSIGAAGTLSCERFVTKAIGSIKDHNTACPFEQKMCRSPSTNLRVDSGFINSHKDLGLNAPPQDRFLARYVLHCAPITTTNYTSQINTSVGNFTVYHYGNMSTPTGNQDHIWMAEPVESQYAVVLSLDAEAPIPNYQIIKDADTAMIFLSGAGVLYSASSDDEWYRVSNKSLVSAHDSEAPNTTPPLYLPLEPASPLGCTEQFQFCHADTEHCGRLASLRDAINDVALLFNSTYDDILLNDDGTEDAEMFKYFTTAFMDYQYVSLQMVLDQLGPASLDSQSTLLRGVQGPLASNQWQRDVAHWADIYLASIQEAFLDIAYVSPNASSVLETRSAFKSEAARKLCNNQKIRSTEYASFSLFGLLFTFLVGILIILASYLLEPISRILYRKWGWNSYAHLEWISLTALQLQRLAHEELGVGTWYNGTEEIPTTETGDLLGCLDISNPDHPILKPPFKEGNSTEESEAAHDTPEESQQTEQDHASSPPSPESVQTLNRPIIESEPQHIDNTPGPVASN